MEVVFISAIIKGSAMAQGDTPQTKEYVDGALTMAFPGLVTFGIGLCLGVFVVTFAKDKED